MYERLQKILSQWGVASRRQAEQMILDGRVRLNGNVVQLGQKANPEVDQIEVDGHLIKPNERPRPLYLLLNKPVGVVSTAKDPWGRSTILDLLPPELQQQGIHSVGRLDADSTGALLLTNDGTLTFYLTHPRHQVAKTYNVWVQGHPSEVALQAWRRGVDLEGRKTLPAEVNVLEWAKDGKTHLEVVLKEGRNRQIRRIAEQLGYPVVQLHRIAIGPIPLGNLPIGHYRPLRDFEINFLQNQISLISVNVPADVKEGSL